MTGLDPKLVARIKKLHNMAEGAREVGSLAEADSFMEAVTKTLAAHNLDMSVLNVELRDLEDPMGVQSLYGIKSRKVPHARAGAPVDWVIDLATAVARAHYCAVNNATKSSYLWFYGRASNRDTAVRMFTYLRDMAEREGWKAYAKEVRRRRKETGYAGGGRDWFMSWLEGFAAEVAARYTTMRARVESDKGMSLILTSARKEANEAAMKALTPEDLKCESKEPLSARGNYAAREAGREVARSANLRPNALENSAPNAPVRMLP
jgi:hypothetical protein